MLRITVSAGRRVYRRETRAQIRGLWIGRPAICATVAPRQRGRRAVTDEILAKRLERGLQSATKRQNRRLSGESRHKPSLVPRPRALVVKNGSVWPQALVGVATGERSGVSVLDVDAKHDAARVWWRTYQSLSRGPQCRAQAVVWRAEGADILAKISRARAALQQVIAA
jgi:hypothetical protein